MKLRHYLALEIMAWVYRGLAILLGISGLLIALGLFVAEREPIAGAVALVIAIISALSIYAVGEFIMLFVNQASDIEVSKEALALIYQMNKRDMKHNGGKPKIKHLPSRQKVTSMIPLTRRACLA
jgi:hypothetical protein